MPQTFWTEAEVSRFATFLLSKERNDNIDSIYQEGDPISKEDRRRQLYHSDFENWKHMEKNEPSQAPEAKL